MIGDLFEGLLQELSTAINIPLKPDAHNSCCIEFPDELILTLEPSVLGDLLQVVIEIGHVDEGKYRENLFREALRANGLPTQHTGTFCYGAKTDMLLLYDHIPMEDINGLQLAERIEQLSQKARIWKDAIVHGDLPPYQGGSAMHHAEGIFGL